MRQGLILEAVTEGFCDVGCGNLRRFGEVSDGARHFERAVNSAAREIHSKNRYKNLGCL